MEVSRLFWEFGVVWRGCWWCWRERNGKANLGFVDCSVDGGWGVLCEWFYGLKGLLFFLGKGVLRMTGVVFLVGEFTAEYGRQWGDSWVRGVISFFFSIEGLLPLVL